MPKTSPVYKGKIRFSFLNPNGDSPCSFPRQHSRSFRSAPTAWASFALNRNGRTAAMPCSKRQRHSSFAAWASPPTGKPFRCGNRPCPHPRSKLDHRRLIVRPALRVTIPLYSPLKHYHHQQDNPHSRRRIPQPPRQEVLRVLVARQVQHPRPPRQVVIRPTHHRAASPPMP